MDKRPPKSTKFEHVQKNVNTGLTVKDVQMKSWNLNYEYINCLLGDNFISNMKKCDFKRIKAGTLVKLLEVS